MPVSPKDIKVPTTTPHSVRALRVRLLVNEIEQLRDELPPGFLSLLVDKDKGISAADELRTDLRANGYHLNEGIAAVLSGIKAAALRIRQYADEAEAAVGRNESGAQRVEVPELIERIIKASDLFDGFIRPNTGRQSTLMREAVIAGVESLRQDSPTPLFGDHFDALSEVLQDDWFQPDEWAENRQFWPEELRALATDGNHRFFDDLFRARLAENEACFTLGLYLASIATSRMVYEDLIRIGVLRIFGERRVKKEGLFEQTTKFHVLTNLLKKKTSFDWFNEGGALYRKGNFMLHSREVAEKLNVEGINDQKLSPNSATRQRRRYREEAKECTRLLAMLVKRMESDLNTYGKVL